MFTGYPALKEAMEAILLQADEILVKPMDVDAMVALIREKLKTRGTKRMATSSALPTSWNETASSLSRTGWHEWIKKLSLGDLPK